MFGQDTPSSILYQDLKSFGGISNKEAARILLSGRISVGGRAPRDRVDERTFLSREVVHAQPGQVNPGIFADLAGASQTLLGRMLANGAGPGRDGILAHYLGPAAAQMQGALAQFGLDSLLYGNEAQRLGRVRLRNESDRSTLALMLFVAAGCLADPAAAVATVEKFAQRFLAMDIGTVETSMGTQVMPDESGPLALGLLRIVNGAARPPIYPLSPAGSTIGSLASGPNAITDVDVDVSRQHLRIWRDGSRWVCQGLGSTNGTMLISGADKSAQVVEPPRSGRSKGTYPPVALERGDILCLGRTTRFLVMALQGAK